MERGQLPGLGPTTLGEKRPVPHRHPESELGARGGLEDDVGLRVTDEAKVIEAVEAVAGAGRDLGGLHRSRIHTSTPVAVERNAAGL